MVGKARRIAMALIDVTGSIHQFPENNIEPNIQLVKKLW